MSIECELDAAVSAAHLPDGSGEATGRAAFHVADWQATTDGSEHLGPVYAKYRECLVLLEAIREGHGVGYWGNIRHCAATCRGVEASMAS